MCVRVREGCLPQPHSLICLSTWSPAGDVVMGGRGVLLEEIGFRRWALRFSSLDPLPVHSLLPVYVAMPPVPATGPSPPCWTVCP